MDYIKFPSEEAQKAFASKKKGHFDAYVRAKVVNLYGVLTNDKLVADVTTSLRNSLTKPEPPPAWAQLLVVPINPPDGSYKVGAVNHEQVVDV